MAGRRLVAATLPLVPTIRVGPVARAAPAIIPVARVDQVAPAIIPVARVDQVAPAITPVAQVITPVARSDPLTTPVARVGPAITQAAQVITPVARRPRRIRWTGSSPRRPVARGRPAWLLSRGTVGR